MPPSFVPAPRAASRRPCRFIRLNFTLSEARGTIIPGGRAATGRFRPRRPPAAGAVPLCTAAGADCGRQRRSAPLSPLCAARAGGRGPVFPGIRTAGAPERGRLKKTLTLFMA